MSPKTWPSRSAGFDPGSLQFIFEALSHYATLLCLTFQVYNVNCVIAERYLVVKHDFDKTCQFVADLVTFTEEILNKKLHFLSSDRFLLSHNISYCFLAQTYPLLKVYWHKFGNFSKYRSFFSNSSPFIIFIYFMSEMKPKHGTKEGIFIAAKSEKVEKYSTIQHKNILFNVSTWYKIK